MGAVFVVQPRASAYFWIITLCSLMAYQASDRSKPVSDHAYQEICGSRISRATAAVHVVVHVHPHSSSMLDYIHLLYHIYQHATPFMPSAIESVAPRPASATPHSHVPRANTPRMLLSPPSRPTVLPSLLYRSEFDVQPSWMERQLSPTFTWSVPSLRPR